MTIRFTANEINAARTFLEILVTQFPELQDKLAGYENIQSCKFPALEVLVNNDDITIIVNENFVVEAIGLDKDAIIRFSPVVRMVKAAVELTKAIAGDFIGNIREFTQKWQPCYEWCLVHQCIDGINGVVLCKRRTSDGHITDAWHYWDGFKSRPSKTQLWELGRKACEIAHASGTWHDSAVDTINAAPELRDIMDVEDLINLEEFCYNHR